MSTKKSTTTTEMLTQKIKLPNSLQIPQIHLGLYEVPPSQTSSVVRTALGVGYRAFDTAQWYSNEAEAGRAISSFLSSPSLNRDGLARSDIFYTTKLRHNYESYDAARESIARSVEASGLGYVDLFLLHSPLGGRKAREASWRALCDAVSEGKVRMAGVSNFGVAHLREFSERGLEREKWPAVNQIECHPFNTQTEIRKVCEEMGIAVQAYAPLARGMRFNARGSKLGGLAKKYGCSEAQILVRWGLQKGFVVLPKSTNEGRMKENADVGWFEISEEDVEVLDGLNEGLVTDWDPTDAP